MKVLLRKPISTYQAACDNCFSQLEFNEKDISYDASGMKVICPVCGTKTRLLHIHYLGKRLEGE